MEFFDKLHVYDWCSLDFQRIRVELAGVGWVDVSRGDATNGNCRLRLVGREFNAGRG